MSWMERLCETYDIFAGEVGVMPLDGKTPLLPIYHTTQQAQLEIALDMAVSYTHLTLPTILRV